MIIASIAEEFLDTKFAPLIAQSRLGKLSVLACYATLIGVALNGFLNLKTYYSFSWLYMTEENVNYNFKQA